MSSFFAWNRRTRVPRRGLDWAVRSVSNPRHVRSSAGVASSFLLATLGGAGVITFVARSDNDSRREGPYAAFLPSVLPAYDPFARKAYKPITADQAESFLLANQRSLQWRSGVVVRHDHNSVASNYPCEDDEAHAFVGGRHYFLQLDGHAGWQVSRYLADNLIARVAADMNTAVPQTDPEVQSVLKNAFVRVDDEMMGTALRLRPEWEAQGSLKPYQQPLEERLKRVQAFDLAYAGSCALMAVCDPRRDRLHIACVGDSRAVMGVWEPTSEDGKHGVWRVQVLSEDQTGNNPKEAKKILAAHPSTEAETIIKDGRILGLAVSRAFGDARFKWKPEDYKATSTMAYGSPRSLRPNYHTPPYISASPEVVSLPLTPPHGRAFVVLASDGIWDELTNSEVVGLVGGWLDGVEGSRSREEVVKLTRLGEHAPDMYMPARDLQDSAPKAFTFRDANLSTHLIRNAVAGAESETLRLKYSFGSSGSSRYERDDMTATVILLGEHDKLLKSPAVVSAKL